MSPANDDTRSSRELESAAEWLLEMREHNVSREQRERFVEWLQASPVHVRAYLEVAAAWGTAAQLGPEVTIDEDSVRQPDFAAKVLSLPVAAPSASNDPAASKPAGSWQQRSPAHLAFAASLFVVIVAAIVWFAVSQSSTRSLVFATRVGEQRTVSLADGSLVRLNARSELRVAFTRNLRSLELVAGEAWFDVAKDAARPFIVRQAGTHVRALGTVFDVNQRGRGTIVTVVSGHVLVSVGSANGNDAAGAANQASLTTGQQATVSGDRSITVKHDVNLTAATGWLDNILTFEDTPLEDVVEELNRYSARPIQLEDEGLRHARINGVIQAGNSEAMVRYLQRFQPVHIVVGEDRIRILRTQVPEPSPAPLLPHKP